MASARGEAAVKARVRPRRTVTTRALREDQRLRSATPAKNNSRTKKFGAKCIENPLYDLVLGNVPQVRDPNDPNPYWESDQQRSDEMKTPTVKGVGHQLDKIAEVPERKD
ncbi:hypothetical protein HPB47_024008 [Ixodes persulcatus]|uniref:Uncharacterized protein n=1 Tax=Ixodes persulcatus TaxID=34615 RepID=A0AC60Q6P7_IXOPE|nr:hypothetical protein HPB47_024008 [Ixodes persulcatus]